MGGLLAPAPIDDPPGQSAVTDQEQTGTFRRVVSRLVSEIRQTLKLLAFFS